MLQSTGVNNPTVAANTSLITHKAAMDGHTGPGVYQQKVTYLVTANF